MTTSLYIGKGRMNKLVRKSLQYHIEYMVKQARAKKLKIVKFSIELESGACVTMEVEDYDNISKRMKDENNS